jgi:hypothetical protein
MTSGTNSRFFTSRSSGSPGSRGTRGNSNSGSMDSEFETSGIAPADSSFGDEDKTARSGNVGSKLKSDGEQSGRSSKNGK